LVETWRQVRQETVSLPFFTDKEAHRETQLHAQRPGQKTTGQFSRSMALVKLSLLLFERFLRLDHGPPGLTRTQSQGYARPAPARRYRNERQKKTLGPWPRAEPRPYRSALTHRQRRKKLKISSML
jgi:hypothetical protein